MLPVSQPQSRSRAEPGAEPDSVAEPAAEPEPDDIAEPWATQRAPRVARPRLLRVRRRRPLRGRDGLLRFLRLGGESLLWRAQRGDGRVRVGQLRGAEREVHSAH